MLAGSEWSSSSGVAHAWVHGLALAHANHTGAEDSNPSYAELMRHIHGLSGLWTEELGKHLGELGLPLGQHF